MSSYIPNFIRTKEQGLLKEKIRQAYAILKNCRLCPKQCGVNRLAEEKGICRTGENALVSDFAPHFGEEPPLTGGHGSGTIFFTFCNLLCIFCQNYEISHLGSGRERKPEEIASMMLHLEKIGCHNINFVTPTHVVPQILKAVDIAAGKGLSIPLVYNSGGYDSVDTLKILEGVIDIYMPDFKFWEPEPARLACKVPDYPDIAKKAIKEMHSQVGDLSINNQGLATHGLLVRHLVLPENMAGTKNIMEFLKNGISPETHVNIMSQYRPCGRAREIKSLSRSVTVDEYRTALKTAKDLGLIVVS